jgi:hydroxymethylbilane synthase
MKRLLIHVGARASALSQAQVTEVLKELHLYHPYVKFDPHFLETSGDKDRSTSLRTLGKTDFFTKEVDNLLLNGFCRIAIHSAKDLPETIPAGLTIASITKGLDSADVLVMRSGCTIDSLPKGAVIATSSERREKQTLLLRSDFKFRDLRGTIAERLNLLQTGEADGVVVAEAALIRLGLTDLNRIKIPGETVPYQGQLAILCRSDDEEMIQLFKDLDTRKNSRKILYLGLEIPEKVSSEETYIHYPIIRIRARPATDPAIQTYFHRLDQYTHFLFTSKSSVHIFFLLLSQFGNKPLHLLRKEMICVGKQTAKTLKAYGIKHLHIPSTETAEGMVDLIKGLHLENPVFFWPHSSLSRPVISNFLKKNQWQYDECVIYDTEINKHLKPIDLETIDEIFFTSPSTVDAFTTLFGKIPQNKILKAIGPVTQEKLSIKIN